MPISTLVEWCRLTREEDANNVLYANFKYELDNQHIKNPTLQKFETQLAAIASNKTPGAVFASDYLNEASKEGELFYEGASFPIPNEGVSRVVTIEGFEREYKSFLNGITTGPEAVEKLYENLNKGESVAERYIANTKSQQMAEKFAKEHTKTLKDVYVARGQKAPADISTLKELNETWPTWVTKSEHIVKILTKTIGNRANMVCRILGLLYKETQVVLLTYKPTGVNRELHKPTIFSLGYNNAYCADGGADGWGCTAELHTGEAGLPEAIAPRYVFSEITGSSFLDTINYSQEPAARHPNINKISERLGHKISNRLNCADKPCDQICQMGFK